MPVGINMYVLKQHTNALIWHDDGMIIFKRIESQKISYYYLLNIIRQYN